MFVRKNQRVYFSGRISSSPFTDEYPYPAVLCAFAPPRDAQIFLLFFAPLRLGAMPKSFCFSLRLRAMQHPENPVNPVQN
jgi:hypothetical protein